MAAANGDAEPPLSDSLQAESPKYNFYQLVRLIEMCRPASTSVGAGADPKHEPVRFRSSFSLRFPPSDVVNLQIPATAPATAKIADAAAEGDQAAAELTVSFFGLGGAHGPLPHALTEWVLERIAAKDFALRDFLDIFHHRLISLLYRVRRHHRLGMEWTSPEHHRFSSYLMALMGMGTPGLQGRLGIPDRPLLRYAGILTKQPRDATGLQLLLGDFFGLPILCLQLRGAMRSLDPDQWTKLGFSGSNQVLGRDALLGTAIWDQQAGIEIELGPVPWSKYQEFLPGRSGLQALGQLVRFYVGPGFDIHVTLILQAEQIPPARLGAAPGKPGAALGLTTFLSHGKPQQGHRVIRLGVIARYSDVPERTGP